MKPTDSILLFSYITAPYCWFIICFVFVFFVYSMFYHDGVCMSCVSCILLKTLLESVLARTCTRLGLSALGPTSATQCSAHAHLPMQLPGRPHLGMLVGLLSVQWVQKHSEWRTLSSLAMGKFYAQQQAKHCVSSSDWRLKWRMTVIRVWQWVTAIRHFVSVYCLFTATFALELAIIACRLY